ncbi:MAG: CDP-diacylglycerol--glycerol-3-phosphate 3-phosphatidyltransferase [Leptospiraceae bacterium]|nr:CDP-diacylglycerol--glycerol-3-phosphate 3-phosphatidyltransferase [Leptospiraceae bacterium]MDW7975027.1 CDP-diacylglycerol--glycerol-3-phosphate 3-phosphatidyltransferase [Leptospiraceae bacterium]
MKFRNKEKFTIPNILTYFRFLSVPIFIYLIVSPEETHRTWGFIIFVGASLSDLIDGYIARKWNQQTELGKFLDPLADKFLVVGALITFLFMTQQVELWMVLFIIARDLLITLLRTLAIRKGTPLKTSVFGKVKTAFQMFSIIVVLLSFLVITYKQRDTINQIYLQKKEAGYFTFEIANEFFLAFIRGEYTDLFWILSSFVPYYLMFITTIITIISGLRYLITNYKLLLPPYK